MQFDYWQKQPANKSLFEDIEWQKPQQKSLAGKLLIIGGNPHSFATVAQSYADALKAGAGECRVTLPDTLKNTIGAQIPDCLFLPTNQSGGLSKEAIEQLSAACAWADTILYIGDAGRSSETAIIYEKLLADFDHKLTIVTRDALDLVKNDWPQMLNRDKTIFIATLAQLQKIFMSVYYPKTILFSMQLTNLVEVLHKFTITYPCTILVFHQGQLLCAQNGKVVTTPWENPNLIWRGSVASRAAVYAMQNQAKLLQAISASLV